MYLIFNTLKYKTQLSRLLSLLINGYILLKFSVFLADFTINFLNKVAQTEAIWAISINSSTPIFLIITQLYMSNNLLLF